MICVELYTEAPSSTPDPNLDPMDDSPTTRPSVQNENSLASELQQRLQSHVSGTKEKHRFVRQFSEQIQSGGNCPDDGTIDVPPTENGTSEHFWGENENGASEVGYE